MARDLTAPVARHGGVTLRRLRFPNLFIAWLVSVCLIFGFAFLHGEAWAGRIFMPTAAIVVVIALVWAATSSTDWFNPLTLLLASVILRVGSPWLLMNLGPPPPGFSWISPAYEFWEQGVALAMFGTLAVVLGWFACSGRLRRSAATRMASLARRAPLTKQVMVAAVLFTLAGLLFIGVFLLSSYSQPLEAVSSGIIRSAEGRAADTSRYRVLGADALVAGTSVLTAYLLIKKRARARFGLLPVAGASAVLTAFGGRVVALTPLAFGLIALWYRRRRSRMSLPHAFLAVGMVACFVMLYAPFVWAYRFGGGLTGGVDALSASSLADYVSFSIWYEAGALHPFALASFFGPGVLEGQTFAGLGGFVTEVWLGLDAVRPGAWMVQELTRSPEPWAIHSGLIVDLYMNVNVAAVLIGAFLFGVALRYVYSGFAAHRREPIVVLVYAIVTWWSFWIFYESITVFFPLLLTLLVLAVLFVASRLLPTRRAA